MSDDVWAQIEAEARDAFHGPGRFPLRAYSELMPPPYVGLKPAGGWPAPHGNALAIDEFEQAHDLEPGLDRIGAQLDRAKTFVTFTPFAELPADVRAGYLAGQLMLVPTPASLVLFEHPRYKQLARELPRARQIPLLHLFPRVETSCAIRIPQSG